MPRPLSFAATTACRCASSTSTTSATCRGLCEATMLDDFKNDARERMQKCVQAFQADLKKLRTGRAHPSLIEHLKVDFYGNEVPLQQVASIAVEEGRTLVISPW